MSCSIKKNSFIIYSISCHSMFSRCYSRIFITMTVYSELELSSSNKNIIKVVHSIWTVFWSHRDSFVWKRAKYFFCLQCHITIIPLQMTKALRNDSFYKSLCFSVFCLFKEFCIRVNKMFVSTWQWQKYPIINKRFLFMWRHKSLRTHLDSMRLFGMLVMSDTEA